MLFLPVLSVLCISCCFFFNDTATTEIYTLSLHDALPIWRMECCARPIASISATRSLRLARSEEHTSELQSLTNIVCRILLEKKNTTHTPRQPPTTSHTQPEQRARAQAT